MGTTKNEVVKLVVRCNGSGVTVGYTFVSEVVVRRDAAVEVVRDRLAEVVSTATAEVVGTSEGAGEVRGASGDCSFAATSSVGTRGFAASATDC